MDLQRSKEIQAPSEKKIESGFLGAWNGPFLFYMPGTMLNVIASLLTGTEGLRIEKERKTILLFTLKPINPATQKSKNLSRVKAT